MILSKQIKVLLSKCRIHVPLDLVQEIDETLNQAVLDQHRGAKAKKGATTTVPLFGSGLSRRREKC